MLRKRIHFLQKAIINNNVFFKRRLKGLQNTYRQPFEVLQEMQSQALVRLVKHAYNSSSFYHNFYNQYGVNISQIQNRDDIRSLPIVTKNIVKQNSKKILTTNAFFCRKAYTSGTSGMPLMLYRDVNSVLEEETYLWKHRIKFGHHLGQRSVSIRGDLDRSTFKIYDPFTKTLHLSNFFLNKKTANRYFKEIDQFRPNAIFTYPSSIEILSNFLLDKGLNLKVPLVFTSSETLYDFQKPKIEKAFNARILDWYGNAERTIALEENKRGTYNELPTYSYNEYMSDHVITTGLINYAFPLIRYKVNDMITPSEHIGEVKQIVGKSDDSIILPDGTRVVRLGGPFKGFKGIDFAQIIQRSHDYIDINIVPNDDFRKKQFSLIRKKLNDRLGTEIEYRFNLIEEAQIKKTERGKFKFVINELLKNNSASSS